MFERYSNKRDFLKIHCSAEMLGSSAIRCGMPFLRLKAISWCESEEM